jgi:hypothetical protein
MSSFQYLIEVDSLSKSEVMMQEVVDRCKKGVVLLDGGIQGLFVYLPFKSAVLLILVGCWWFL